MSSEIDSPGPRLIVIYTDGSFDAGTRFGGWAFVAYEDGRELYRESGGQPGETNNGFEVLAVLRASTWAVLKFPMTPIQIWTDSNYVMQGFHRWLPIWRNNGWKKIDQNHRHRRRPSPDVNVWRQLDELVGRGSNIRIEWCKAHSGDVANELADQMANAGRFEF